MTATPDAILVVPGELTNDDVDKLRARYNQLNVVQALSRVLADLPGIGKGDRASQAQGGYAYRGIEAITKEVAPLFAKHGVVFVPHILSWERDEITVNGKPWTDDRMTISYTVYGPGGAGDCIEVGPIPAIGRDNSDKGANKCMTQAFKYALLQVLCIADGKDDGDRESHEAEFADIETPTVRRQPAPMPGFPNLNEQQKAHDAYADLAKTATEETREAMKRWRADNKLPYPMSASDLNSARQVLERAIAQEKASGPGVPFGGDAEAPGPVSEVAGGVREEGVASPPGSRDAPPAADDYDALPKIELLAECAERQIDAPANANKADLVEKLRAWDRTFADAS